MHKLSTLEDLHQLLGFGRLTHIVDVGANPIDGEPPYKELLKSGLCDVTGFEPQEQALSKLNKNKSDHENYLPYAVGDGTVKTLNICAYSGWTSTFKPSALSLDTFERYRKHAEIIDQIRIETRRLDDLEEIGEIDFLKIDIQGGELEVFQNARRKLSNTAVIQTEISFVNLYDGQPTFGEVDTELRKQGFIPHTFTAVRAGIIAPLLLNGDPTRSLNQLIEADMIYVKDFRDPKNLDDDQIRNMCLIAHSCYRSYDLAMRCLRTLQERKSIPADSVQRYLDLVNTILNDQSTTP